MFVALHLASRFFHSPRFSSGISISEFGSDLSLNGQLLARHHLIIIYSILCRIISLNIIYNLDNTWDGISRIRQKKIIKNVVRVNSLSNWQAWSKASSREASVNEFSFANHRDSPLRKPLFPADVCFPDSDSDRIDVSPAMARQWRRPVLGSKNRPGA